MAASAFGQEPAETLDGDACNVVTGSLEVNDKGELTRPAPTAEQCAAAAAVVDKFLSMDPRAFGRIVSREAIPGNVYTSIRRYGVFGGPWSVGGLPGSDRPELRHAVSWLTDKLVVIVTETSDFSGPKTTVVIADIESLQVCNFPNWPSNEDPRRLSVAEIQEILDQGLGGDRPTPACHLEPLVVD